MSLKVLNSILKWNTSWDLTDNLLLMRNYYKARETYQALIEKDLHIVHNIKEPRMPMWLTRKEVVREVINGSPAPA